MESITNTTPLGVSRRSFLQRAGIASVATAAITAGAGLITGANTAYGLHTSSDVDILNFALNLEYLEAEFYWYAVYGSSITTAGVNVSGTGTPGGVTIKSSPQVMFTRDRIRQYAIEIANDEKNHVKALRATITSLGGTPAARPAINLRESFNTLAAAAGIGPAFDPFLSDKNFLLAAFIFEDVGVTAYKGAARYIDNPDVLEAAAGILAVEAYHAGNIRSQLSTLVIQEGLQDITSTVEKISNLRDTLDGTGDTDQALFLGGKANIVPADASGLAYSRTSRQVLNIVYGAPNATKGLFFPAGLNGAVK